MYLPIYLSLYLPTHINTVNNTLKVDGTGFTPLSQQLPSFFNASVRTAFTFDSSSGLNKHLWSRRIKGRLVRQREREMADRQHTRSRSPPLRTGRWGLLGFTIPFPCTKTTLL